MWAYCDGRAGPRNESTGNAVWRSLGDSCDYHKCSTAFVKVQYGFSRKKAEERIWARFIPKAVKNT